MATGEGGGLFINIAGGVQSGTLKSLREFANSLSTVAAAARGLQKTDPGSGMNSAIKSIKQLESSVQSSINSIINNIDKYKQSVEEVSKLKMGTPQVEGSPQTEGPPEQKSTSQKMSGDDLQVRSRLAQEYIDSLGRSSQAEKEAIRRSEEFADQLTKLYRSLQEVGAATEEQQTLEQFTENVDVTSARIYELNGDLKQTRHGFRAMSEGARNALGVTREQFAAIDKHLESTDDRLDRFQAQFDQMESADLGAFDETGLRAYGKRLNELETDLKRMRKYQEITPEGYELYARRIEELRTKQKAYNQELNESQRSYKKQQQSMQESEERVRSFRSNLTRLDDVLEDVENETLDSTGLQVYSKQLNELESDLKRLRRLGDISPEGYDKYARQVEGLKGELREYQNNLKRTNKEHEAHQKLLRDTAESYRHADAEAEAFYNDLHKRMRQIQTMDYSSLPQKQIKSEINSLEKTLFKLRNSIPDDKFNEYTRILERARKNVRRKANETAQAQKIVAQYGTVIRSAANAELKREDILNNLTTAQKAGTDSLRRHIGSLDKYNKRLNISTKVSQAFSGALEKISARVRQFAAFVAAATIIQGLQNQMREAVRVISNFDQSLRNLEAIINITSSQASMLGDVIKDVSRTTKFSAQEVSEGMRNLGQAGMSLQESMSAIEGVARLATGTMSDFETVADLTTTTINAFDLAATESARIADVFANAINESKLSVDKLSTAFNYVGAAGKQAGLNLNEVSGTLMTLADNGIRASTMGTGLRRMMLKMIDASSELGSDLRVLDKSIDDVNPKIVGWEKSLENLVPLLWDTQRQTVDMGKATDYFGTRAAQVAAVLVRNAADGSNALNDAINTTKEFGAAQRMADTQIKGLSLSFKNLQDRLKLVAVALGEAGLTDVLQFFVDTAAAATTAVEKFINGLGGLVGKITLITSSFAAFGAAMSKLVIPAIVSLVGRIHTAATASGVMIAKFGGAAKSAGTLATAATALKGALTSLATSVTFLSGVVGGLVYLVYRTETANERAAKAASKAAQEFGALGKAAQEWGKSLEDAFGNPDQWDNTLKRLEDVEVAGVNLSRELEEKLGVSLESVPRRGVEGFRELKRAVDEVSLDAFSNQMEKSIEQIDKFYEDVHSHQKNLGIDTKGWRGALGELEDETKDALYNITETIDNFAEQQDWGLDEVSDKTQEVISEIKKVVDEESRANQIVDEFVNSMTKKWGGEAAREIDYVIGSVGNLTKQLENSEISLEDFKKAYKELPTDSLIPEEEIDNINSVEEAHELLFATMQKLNVSRKDFENQIDALFKGEKELGEVITYVTEEMSLNEEMSKRLVNTLQNLSEEVNSGVDSFDIFIGKLKRISPEAVKTFEELSDVQKAELMASMDDIEDAGDELRKRYEKSLKVDLEELLEDPDKLTKKQVTERLAPWDVNSVEEAWEEIRKLQKEKYESVLEDLRDESDDKGNVFDNWRKQIENSQKQALMSVKENSLEALRIQEKHAASMLALARKRWADDPNVENYGKLLDAKKDYRDKSREIEERITQDIIDEAEERASSREAALKQREADLERERVTGQIKETEYEMQLADERIAQTKESIKAQEQVISKLEERGAAEEEVKSAKEELVDLELELQQSETERIETYIDNTNKIFDREKELAEKKKEAALAGIEEEKERINLVNSQREGVLAEIEKEQDLNYENAQKKLQAEMHFKNEILRIHNERLRSLEEKNLEESDAYKDAQREKTEFTRKINEELKQLQDEKVRAQIRSEGHFFDRVKLGFKNARDDVQGWGDFTVETAEEVFNNFAEGAAEAFTDFATGAKSAEEAFREFARNFLNQIAQMITKQLAFNAVSAVTGAMGGGIYGGASAGGSAAMALQGVSTMHEGGIVGKDGGTQIADMFKNMTHLHNGIQPDEYHAVLQKGEKVTPKNNVDEEKERLTNIEKRLDRQEKEKDKGTRIVNVLDPGVVDEWASSSRGEKIIMNTLTRNKDQLRRIL